MGSIAEIDFASPSAPRRKITSSQIEELRSLLDPSEAELIDPTDFGYSATLKRYSAAAEKPAGASLIPTSTSAISTAIKYVSAHNLELAIKGGGHSTAGASSTNGGLLIDLAKMNSITVDSVAKTVTVAGGVLWGEVDEAVAAHGLATVGGTVGDTGVGGLTLGGGYGWLSGEHGLVIDNLLSCTLVLADGSVKICSATENTDLFWAVRGAGQNFGVATSFTFQAHPQSDLWSGLLMFPPTPQLIASVVDILSNLYMPASGPGTASAVKGHAGSGLAFVRPPAAGGQVMMLVAVTVDGTEEEGRALFQPLLDLHPIVNTMAMVPFPMINKLLPIPYGLRVSMKGASFTMPLRADFVQQVYAAYARFTDAVPNAAASIILFEMFDPLVVATRASNTDMAFANRGFQFNGMIAPMWTDETLDAECRQWARDVAAMFKTELRTREDVTSGVNGGVAVKSKDINAVMLYGNYDQYDENSRDIFGANYPRLQELKARYDPTNLFNKLFAIST